MNTTNEKLAGLINSLIEINNDRVEGYERAAKETDDSDLKALFSQLASDSRGYRSELSREVTNMGAKPEEGTTTSGKFYRAWMDIKAALTGKDRKAILSSCEYGEDVALETYKDALKSDIEIPAGIRQIITSQKEKLQESHNSIKALRDSVEAH